MLSIWTNHVAPRASERQRYSYAIVLSSTRRVQHTPVRIGFAAYKPLIHTAIDNPFLLYYRIDRYTAPRRRLKEQEKKNTLFFFVKIQRLSRNQSLDLAG
jgi:hypothetical protein